MHPAIHLNWLAIVVSVVASFLVGGLWYGPLFGGAWRKEMGVPADAKPLGGEIGKSLGINIIGTFLTAYVLAHESRSGGRPRGTPVPIRLLPSTDSSEGFSRGSASPCRCC
jgi:hypothetical protein